MVLATTRPDTKRFYYQTEKNIMTKIDFSVLDEAISHNQNPDVRETLQKFVKIMKDLDFQRERFYNKHVLSLELLIEIVHFYGPLPTALDEKLKKILEK